MKVLVLGGTGFLSSAIAATLRAAGHDVAVFTRGRRPVPEGVETIRGDRQDPASLSEAARNRTFDAVIDCICYAPEEARAAVEAFAGRASHYVMISTDFVYGPYRTLPMDEDTPTQALNDYGRNKVACEEVFLAAWREAQFPATIFRPPHILGAGGHLGTGSLQGRDPMLLDRLERRAPVILLDGGALLIQPVVHRDVGKACVAALGKPETFGRAYNVAGPDCVPTREYYAVIAAVLGVEEPEFLSLPSAQFVRAFPERAPFAQHRMYRMDRLERDTGYRPDTSLRHAIYETIDWLQASGTAQPYVETERERRLVEACRRFEAEAAAALSGPAAA